ncbi:MAG: hypothetical protein IK104_01450 [Clostridia bacterium]|nr:hypothetical protein [Clostridia bacterium]
MARYESQYQISLPRETVFAQINEYLRREGYEYTSYQNEILFKKGHGVVAAPSFVSVTFPGNTVKLQAFIKFAVVPGVYAGEMNLEGVTGFAVKDPLKARIRHIEENIILPGGGIFLNRIIEQTAPPDKSNTYAIPLGGGQGQAQPQQFPRQPQRQIPQQQYAQQPPQYAQQPSRQFPQPQPQWQPQADPNAGQVRQAQPQWQPQPNPYAGQYGQPQQYPQQPVQYAQPQPQWQPQPNAYAAPYGQPQPQWGQPQPNPYAAPYGQAPQQWRQPATGQPASPAETPEE